jgi:hypothetical protein
MSKTGCEVSEARSRHRPHRIQPRGLPKDEPGAIITPGAGIDTLSHELAIAQSVVLVTSFDARDASEEHGLVSSYTSNEW